MSGILPCSLLRVLPPVCRAPFLRRSGKARAEGCSSCLFRVPRPDFRQLAPSSCENARSFSSSPSASSLRLTLRSPASGSFLRQKVRRSAFLRKTLRRDKTKPSPTCASPCLRASREKRPAPCRKVRGFPGNQGLPPACSAFPTSLPALRPFRSDVQPSEHAPAAESKRRHPEQAARKNFRPCRDFDFRPFFPGVRLCFCFIYKCR